MRRAIGDLEQFADKRLFEELSEGMPLIVDNAARLDDTTHRLHRDGEFRASEIMQGFAEEEAAKFLILIDYVRLSLLHVTQISSNWRTKFQKPTAHDFVGDVQSPFRQ